jgi:hypothetical protein
VVTNLMVEAGLRGVSMFSPAITRPESGSTMTKLTELGGRCCAAITLATGAQARSAAHTQARPALTPRRRAPVAAASDYGTTLWRTPDTLAAMKSKTRYMARGPFSALDLGAGNWVLSQTTAAAQIHLRLAASDAPKLALICGARTLAVDWRDDAVSVTWTTSAGTDRLSAHSVLVHESTEGLV